MGAKVETPVALTNSKAIQAEVSVHLRAFAASLWLKNVNGRSFNGCFWCMRSDDSWTAICKITLCTTIGKTCSRVELPTNAVRKAALSTKTVKAKASLSLDFLLLARNKAIHTAEACEFTLTL